MRKFIATAALAAAVVLSGSGTALAHDYMDDNDTPSVNLVEVETESTVVVCGDFSECAGDVG